VNERALARAVDETVRRLHGVGQGGRKRTWVAVDATGLVSGAVSTFFVRCLHHHGQKPLPWRYWLKRVVVVGLDRRCVLAQMARRGPWNDCASLPAVVQTAWAARRIQRSDPYLRNSCWTLLASSTL
jgi:hypothetical protein